MKKSFIASGPVCYGGEIQFYLEIITCDQSIYTLDHPKFIVSNQKEESIYAFIRPDFFLLLDLQDFFSDLGSGGGDRKNNSENDQSTGHFQSFFLFFFYISRTNSKMSNINQQSVLNL